MDADEIIKTAWTKIHAPPCERCAEPAAGDTRLAGAITTRLCRSCAREWDTQCLEKSSGPGAAFLAYCLASNAEAAAVRTGDVTVATVAAYDACVGMQRAALAWLRLTP